MSSITMSYHVHPPTGTIPPKDTPASRSLVVSVGSSQDNEKLYYGALHEAIVKAKDEIGVDLTIWRDAVGKLELTKETKSTKNTHDGDAEEEDEE
ncbi:hypothetical protein BDP27DRAFT_808186 [Rhodocollybia butyracea]|uniref:Uncharacterized protein n=1 Tax=Rhodocollybia butyracea TaxID=206335 RepID=A0A9P5Q709_9AGAR|nr:hypothetical protein BDP27DRAFT_808186 [Rhodocollybia butyracea]